MRRTNKVLSLLLAVLLCLSILPMGVMASKEAEVVTNYESLVKSEESASEIEEIEKEAVISDVPETVFITANVPNLSLDGASSLPSNLYITHHTTDGCTLGAATMMLRSRMYLSGRSDWTSVTEDSVKTVAWAPGLRYSFTYNVPDGYMAVRHIETSCITVERLKSLLNAYPEGIDIC